MSLNDPRGREPFAVAVHDRQRSLVIASLLLRPDRPTPRP
jgi:hypothetical protein